MGVGLQPLNRGVDFARGNAYIFFVKESQKKQRDEKKYSILQTPPKRLCEACR